MATNNEVWTVYSVIDLEERPILKFELVRDRASLEAKIIALGSGNFFVHEGEPLAVTIDTSPRITFGEPPVKKPRAKRRTSAEVATDKAAKLEARAKASNAKRLIQAAGAR